MPAYVEDDRGRLFRWDRGLATWFRIPPDDDEYDAALSVVHGSGPGSRAGAEPRELTSALS